MSGPAQATRISTYAEFWPFYVFEHSHRTNRLLHFLGTCLGVVIVTSAVLMQRWELAPLAIVIAYGMAWVGHFFVQKNVPATFRYPVWSFVSDFRMCALILQGKMESEVIRCIKIIKNENQIKQRQNG